MPKHDMSDPRVRRKLSKHYQREWRKHVRRTRWRLLWQALNAPHFAAIDMILLALTTALLAAGWVWVLDRL